MFQNQQNGYMDEQYQYHPSFWESPTAYIVDHLIILCIMYFIICVIVAIVRGSTPKVVYSRWDAFIDNFNYSSDAFYNRLKDVIREQGIDGVEMRQEELYQGMLFFSAKRIYLHIRWNQQAFHICCAPFAKGMFFSSWGSLYLDSAIHLLLYIPLVRRLVLMSIQRFTYYRYDEAAMLRTVIHRSLLQVIDEVSNKEGMRGLGEQSRNPNIIDIFKK